MTRNEFIQRAVLATLSRSDIMATERLKIAESEWDRLTACGVTDGSNSAAADESAEWEEWNDLPWGESGMTVERADGDGFAFTHRALRAAFTAGFARGSK